MMPSSHRQAMKVSLEAQLRQDVASLLDMNTASPLGWSLTGCVASHEVMTPF